MEKGAELFTTEQRANLRHGLMDGDLRDRRWAFLDAACGHRHGGAHRRGGALQHAKERPESGAPKCDLIQKLRQCEKQARSENGWGRKRETRLSGNAHGATPPNVTLSNRPYATKRHMFVQLGKHQAVAPNVSHFSSLERRLACGTSAHTTHTGAHTHTHSRAHAQAHAHAHAPCACAGGNGV